MTSSGERADAPRYMPLAVDVARMPCLVVGGGPAGARKALALLQYGARVTVVSPEICEALEPSVSSQAITWIRGVYEPELQTGYRIVIAATSDALLNRRIAETAEELGQLCCNVSSGRESRLIFPASAVVDGLCIGVHSNGIDCVRSKQTRDDIAAWLTQPGGGRCRASSI